jgi:hypothetical protein
MEVVGDDMWDVGVGCIRGEMVGGRPGETPSGLGMPVSDLRFCAYLLTAYRCMGCDTGAAETGMRVGPKFGLPPFALNSACTSIPVILVSVVVGHSQESRPRDRRLPFSSRMRSSKEFLYRSIRHSSAALRWLC